MDAAYISLVSSLPIFPDYGYYYMLFSMKNFCGVLYAGMMGSGKTTVGKILSEALNYSFVDRLVI